MNVPSKGTRNLSVLGAPGFGDFGQKPIDVIL
jgi:hypothetical protein